MMSHGPKHSPETLNLSSGLKASIKADNGSRTQDLLAEMWFEAGGSSDPRNARFGARNLAHKSLHSGVGQSNGRQPQDGTLGAQILRLCYSMQSTARVAATNELGALMNVGDTDSYSQSTGSALAGAGRQLSGLVNQFVAKVNMKVGDKALVDLLHSITDDTKAAQLIESFELGVTGPADDALNALALQNIGNIQKNIGKVVKLVQAACTAYSSLTGRIVGDLRSTYDAIRAGRG